MYGSRKTDKYKLLEGRGTGSGRNYIPWIKVHEFGSYGRVHRVIGWKYDRVYQFMSDLEYYYFLLLQWNDNVKEIKEQYPMLPIEETMYIAEELGFAHIPKNSKDKTVMTTDFLLLIESGRTLELVARTVKPLKQLENKRTLEKLMIEERYWNKKGVDWEIVTEKVINETMAKNIANLYTDYFWNLDYEYKPRYGEGYIKILTEIMKKSLERNDFQARESLMDFSEQTSWSYEEGLSFLRYLIVRKIAKTNLKEPLNFNNMKVHID